MNYKCSTPETRRSYILHPYEMVHDHMTGVELGNPREVLDGDIDSLLLARIKYRFENEYRWGNQGAATD